MSENYTIEIISVPVWDDEEDIIIDYEYELKISVDDLYICIPCNPESSIDQLIQGITTLFKADIQSVDSTVSKMLH